jgi:vanillate O-demethylase monooxygenase subunit
MRLSHGRVQGDRLVCPYHAWSFDAAGQGESPGSPKLQVRTAHFVAADHAGLIWIREDGEACPLPAVEPEGYELLHLAYVPLKAPVEALMENLNEIEHTGEAHGQFGYDPARMAEVEFDAQADDNSVRVLVAGPQKRMWRISQWALGARTGDCFKFDWTTRFPPLHTVGEYWWEGPRSHEDRPCRFKQFAYYIPVGPAECIWVSYYLWSFRGARRWLRRLLRPFVGMGARYEIRVDKWLIENVIPQTLESTGRRLGRFDKGLNELRQRWRRWREEYAVDGAPAGCAQDQTAPAGPSVERW